MGRRLSDTGALAVLLTGGRATGDEHERSDIDLIALYRRRRGKQWHEQWSMSHVDGYLVTVTAHTEASARASMKDPRRIPTDVPGWQRARVIADPYGVARQLKREARTFTWEAVGAECDAWVAAATTGWAEEVHKLVAMRDRGEQFSAAVQRSLLAIRLAPILAIHRRILYGSENRLWDAVADSLGEPWASTQRKALAIDDTPLEESAQAALRLYSLATDEVFPVLSEVQRDVVIHARALIDAPSG